MKYEAPQVQDLGSLHALTQTTKYTASSSDGYYLGVKGDPGAGTLPLNS